MATNNNHRLFLLDAMALIYRAHFVFIKNPRMTTKGLNTSAVYGFANTLFEILNKEQPTHLGVAFDTHAPTFRHEAFEEYKANREETPEDILLAIPYVKKMLDALAIPILEIDGYEADDVIGTLAHKAAAEGYTAYMLTPDKDYAQLVKENVLLYRPASRFKKTEILDEEGVKAKFKVRPDQIADFLGLKGDSVDNIPGVPKIGDKTAVGLLEEFDTVENLLDNLEKVSRKAVRKSLEEHRDQATLSKELATIHTEVPIDFVPDKLKVGEWKHEELEQLFRELEFRSLARRILDLDIEKTQVGLFAEQRSDGGEPLKAPDAATASAPATLEDVEHTYHLADSPEKRKKLLEVLQQAPVFCFDTETTSLRALEAELVGIAFATLAHEAWYVPFPEDRADALALLEEFRPVLEQPGPLKIAQNLKYDWLVLGNYGLKVAGPYYDTMIAHYVAHAESKHGMDRLAQHYLHYKPKPIEELIGKQGKKQKTMRQVPVEEVYPYACEDADITFQLWQATLRDLEKNEVKSVYEEVELPLITILGKMEQNGVMLDREFLANYSTELEKELEEIEQKVWDLAGRQFNVNSPKQLGEVIFDKLKLGKGKRTKSGQYSTDERTLSKLAAEGHELPSWVLEYRSVAKLKSTYVDALPELVDTATELLHTSYNQAVAVTGRLSSNNPNLQNIPIRTERGREIRKAFIPRDEQHTLLSADYSQIELRIMASFSKDEALLRAFQEEEDIHRRTAAKVFGVDFNDVSSEQRRRAKMVNFGMIYGITPFGLSERLQIPRSEAKEIHENFFKQFPGVKEYMDSSVEKAREHGYASTLLGRKHYIKDINSKNRTVRQFAERNAINTPIQGTAAEMIKLAMIKLDKAMREADLKSKMMLQVHDELVFDARKDELETLQPMVIQCMESAMELEGVPVVVESGTGANWLEAH